eukprot:45818-Eustigmatos_ZCMA.PRE.1
MSTRSTHARAIRAGQDILALLFDVDLSGACRHFHFMSIVPCYESGTSWCRQPYTHACSPAHACTSLSYPDTDCVYIFCLARSCHALLYGYFYLSSFKKVPTWIATAVAPALTL